MFPDELRARAAALIDRYRAEGRRIATAESCTGGLVAALLTEIAGSSDVFDRAFVVYSNAAKTDMLGVAPALLAEHGAVSAAAARAMAEGALARSAASVAVAVTGIAGPGGGSVEKPAGLVHFARAARGGEAADARRVFAGGRADVRRASAAFALALLEAAR